MENNPFCIVGMPSWTPAMPFHALAQVGGIARDANHPFTIADLNIEFYHHVDEQDRIYWDDSRINIWAGDEFCAKMWERHAAWFRERLDSIIEAQRPSLIGFSVNMSNRYLSVQASRHVKSSHPDIPVLFGGIECFPKKRNTFFLENGHCDIICQGEAEISLKAFLESFAQTGSIKTDVPGFAYIDGDEIIDTGPVTLPTLRSPLPLPAFDRFDMEKYTCKGRLLPFFLSRGASTDATSAVKAPTSIHTACASPKRPCGRSSTH